VSLAELVGTFSFTHRRQTIHIGDIYVVVIRAGLGGAIHHFSRLLPSVRGKQSTAQDIPRAIAILLAFDCFVSELDGFVVILLGEEDACTGGQRLWQLRLQFERAGGSSQSFFDPARIATVQLELHSANIGNAGVR